MRQTIKGGAFRSLAISAAASVEIHKQELNDLNVFPVPDGDTGTNMSLTIQTAATELRTAEPGGSGRELAYEFVLEELLRINVERIDEKRGILHTRRHLAATPIFKGIPDFRQTRISMLRAETMEELMGTLERVRERLNSL